MWVIGADAHNLTFIYHHILNYGFTGKTDNRT